MNAIKLDTHRVIEASAGAGKTFAIEELVERLLREERLGIDEILVVTYTEKAAGELRQRLRGRLEGALAAGAAPAEPLQAALDDFDQAPIYTIHGFCHRLLTDFAFENGEDFSLKLASETELARRCLREVQRRTWPVEFADLLAPLLDVSDFAANRERWETKALQLATSYRPWAGHRLLPATDATWAANYQASSEKLRAAWTATRALAEAAGPLQSEPHPWRTGFASLEGDARNREAREREVLVPLLGWLADPEAPRAPLTSYYAALGGARSDAFDTHGFRSLTTGLAKKCRDDLPLACKGLVEAVEALEAARPSDLGQFGRVLLARSVEAVLAQLVNLKRERGWITYEDMLSRVDEALDPARNRNAALLREALRSRYAVAIVDEFQDTDPVQWRILSSLFLGEPRRRLIVVGDPKQSIYRFRGADLPTYLEATRLLQERHGAAPQRLAENWRSCPELLAALNQLFERGAVFPPESGLRYEPVAAAPAAARPNQIVADGTGRAALTLVDLCHDDALTDLRRQYARFVADEVKRLLGNAGAAPLLGWRHKDQPARPLDAGDICILVSKRNESLPLIDALRAARVPYSFYKETGLWQTDEAMHLAHVLQAISRPHDEPALRKALLTRFFRVPLGELSQDAVPAHHPARLLLGRWRGMARGRRWAALFQSLLEETGILFAEPNAPDTERRLSNLRHMMHTLAQEAYAEDLDLFAVLDRLAGRRKNVGDEEAGLQPLETERARVRIMTVHTAKGLEFPIVFFAGGFTGGQADEVYRYRGEDGGVVFDLAGGDEAKRKSKMEREQEDRRLLYVALTRAMFKLYVPWLDAARTQHAGPSVTILAKALDAAGPLEHAAECSVAAGSAGPARSAAGSAANRRRKPMTIAEAFPAPPRNLAQRRLHMTSFSRKRSSVVAAEETFDTVEDAPPAADEGESGRQGVEPFRGIAFGHIVHEVLERVDFAIVAAAANGRKLLDHEPTRRLIEERVDRHWSLFPARVARGAAARDECIQSVANLTWHALQTPLEALGCRLCDVPPADRMHEANFLFRAEPAPPAETFCSGVMDLVVRRGNAIFLLDWKTNDLHGDYTLESIRQSMEESGYHEQYALYLRALTGWINRWPGGQGQRPTLGGVYYLYVRGMNARDETSGVFFAKAGS